MTAPGKHPAIENLREFQRQLDADGIEVGVPGRSRAAGGGVAAMPEHSPLTSKLISDGLKPTAVPAPPSDLRQRLHAAAMHVLTKGAPGLSETSCNALAVLIALRCEGVVRTQERAA